MTHDLLPDKPRGPRRDVVMRRFMAGESIQDLARAYMVSPSWIEKKLREQDRIQRAKP